jgi:UDP-2,3-diacylglucosamine pyrophosphatase LpxH
MKKIRKISQNPVAIILVLFNFIFVSCNRDEIMKEQIEQKTVKSYLVKSVITIQYYQEKNCLSLLFLQMDN